MEAHRQGTLSSSPADNAPVIAELATASLIIGGLVVFAFACAVAWTKGSWRKTSAVVHATGGETHLRWHDTRYEICEATLSERQSAAIAPRSEVDIYYQVHAHANWSLDSPHRRTWTAAAVGLLLTLVGTAVSLIGLIEL